MDFRRLQMEIAEMGRSSGLQDFVLCSDDTYLESDWRRYSWIGQACPFHRIEVQYSLGYPYLAPNIFIDPKPDTHHYFGNSICYYKGSEWSPNYTAVTAIGISFRFLHDYLNGRLD